MIPKDLWPTIAGFADERTLLNMRLASHALHVICTRQLRRDPRVRRWLDLCRFLDSDDPRPTEEKKVENAMFVYTDAWFWQIDNEIETDGEEFIEVPEHMGCIYLSGEFCALGKNHIVRRNPLRIEEHKPPYRDITSFPHCSLDGKVYGMYDNKLYENDCVIESIDVTNARLVGGSAYGVWIRFPESVFLYEGGILKKIADASIYDNIAASAYFLSCDGIIYDRAGKIARRGAPVKNMDLIHMNLDNDWITFEHGSWGDDEATAVRYSSP